MKRVTIKDIASELGISIGTVYRALNNTGRIKEETKKRVLDKAEELHYQPNLVARKFAMRSRFRILTILPTEPAFYWNDIRLGLSMVEQELSEFGVEFDRFDMRETPVPPTFFQDVIAKVEEFRPDGIALVPSYSHNADKLLGYFQSRHIPVAIFNQGAEFRGRLFYYGPNDTTSGALAGELFGKLTRGRGTVCVVNSRPEFTQLSARMQGFCSYLARHFPDIVVPSIYGCLPGEENELIDTIFKKYPDVSGFYTMDCNQTGIFAEKLQERGMEGIALIGHEASPLARLMLEKGAVSALLCEKKVCQGYYPIKLLYEYLVDGSLPEQAELYTEINVVLEGNSDFLDEYRYGRGYL